jgi:hypothetical protein
VFGPIREMRGDKHHPHRQQGRAPRQRRASCARLRLYAASSPPAKPCGSSWLKPSPEKSDGFAEARPAGGSGRVCRRSSPIVSGQRTPRPKCANHRLPATSVLDDERTTMRRGRTLTVPQSAMAAHRASYRHTDFMTRPDRIGKKTVHALVTVEKWKLAPAHPHGDAAHPQQPSKRRHRHARRKIPDDDAGGHADLAVTQLPGAVIGRPVLAAPQKPFILRCPCFILPAGGWGG